jgi:hypothetical protein
MSTPDSAPPAGDRALSAGEESVYIERPLPVVHPGTGELFEDLESTGPERLADLLLAIRDKQAALKEADHVVSDEIRQRMELRGRRAWVVGDYGLELDAGQTSVWDADELEVALRQLVDDGVLSARECTGLLTHEVVVHRSELNRVIARLQGPARELVVRCRTWRGKTSTPRVRVQRQVNLIEETE